MAQSDITPLTVRTNMLLRSTLAALAHNTAAYASTTSVTTRNIAVFPNGTWVENINILSNGQPLVTLVNVPELYQVDPRRILEPRLVQWLPGVEALLGIAEVTPDVFAVIAGNFSLADSRETGRNREETIQLQDPTHAESLPAHDVYHSLGPCTVHAYGSFASCTPDTARHRADLQLRY